MLQTNAFEITNENQSDQEIELNRQRAIFENGDTTPAEEVIEKKIQTFHPPQISENDYL